MIKRTGADQPPFPSADQILNVNFDIAAAIGVYESMELPAMLLTAQDDKSPIQFLYVNDAFTSLCGYESQEAIGQTTALLQGEETDIDAARQFRRDIEQNGSGFATLINYRKDHSAYEVFLLGAKVRKSQETEEEAPSFFCAFASLVSDAAWVPPRRPH